jgi:hypothetical protein
MIFVDVSARVGAGWHQKVWAADASQRGPSSLYMFTLCMRMSVLSTCTLLKYIRRLDVYPLDVYVICIKRVNFERADMHRER